MTIKPLAIKISATIIGAGGAFAIAHQTYKALQNKPKEETKILNSQKLISEKYTALGQESVNDSKWNEILSSYKATIQVKKDLGFENFDGTETASGLAIKALKSKCKLALTSEDNLLLDKARKWCVTPISVKDLLNARGYEALKTNGDVSDSRKNWEEKIKNYWKTKKEKPNTITIITSQEKTSIEDGVITEIKGKCDEFSKIMSHKEEFRDTLENFGLWCANKK